MWKLWNLLKNKVGTKRLICGILGICIAVAWMWSLAAWRVSLVDMKSYEAQRGIADEVFRFHVLANSDSDEDQRVKLEVRDAVIAYMKSEMMSDSRMAGHVEQTALNSGKDLAQTDSFHRVGFNVSDMTEAQESEKVYGSSAQATKKWAQMHLQELIQVADDVLDYEGMDYKADAQVTECYFPEKTYGDLTFPQGKYEALRITLGKAAGHNWWCVLYPNLCFLDETCAVVSDDGKEELKGVLTDNEYHLLTDDKELKIKWFFFGD